MDLETVLLIPISPTMGSAKTGGDTFIVLGAISFWFDIVGLVSLPRAEIEWSGWIYFSMVILVPLHRVYHRRKPE